MRTMQLPALSEAPDMTIGFSIDGEHYRAAIRNGELSTARTDDLSGDVLLRVPSARPIAGALYGDIPLAALEAEAGLVVEGDRDILKRFFDLFALPPKLDLP